MIKKIKVITIFFFFFLYSFHTQVSYEEFKLQFAQMYEHYEKHRTDNITDPELRQSRPISTISGWDQERDENMPHQHQIQQSQQVQTVATEEFDEKEDSEQVKITENGIHDKEPTQKSTISSISDVYNKEISGEITVMESPESPERENKLKEILEEELYNENAEQLESEEMVKEIVNEILEKSEKLLDNCKQTADDMMNQEETAVIKDEELEQAVHEVVQGVREIEKQNQLNKINEHKAVEEEANDKVEPTDAIKTDTLSCAIISVEEIDETKTTNSPPTERMAGDGEEEVAQIEVASVEKLEKEKDDEVAAVATIMNEDGKQIIAAVIEEIIDESIEMAVNKSEVAVEAEVPIAIKEEVKIVVNGANNDVKEEETVIAGVTAITPGDDTIEMEQQVKAVIDNIIDDAVKEVEQQMEEIKLDDDEVVVTTEMEEIEELKDEPISAFDSIKETTESDLVNNNITESAESPEHVATKIRFSTSNDSALPSSLSDDSPINESKTNNSTPSPSTSNNDQQQEHPADRLPQHEEINSEPQHKRQKSTSNRPMFSPGPTRPPFRIPEFKWSYIHQRLLSDVLFSLETDIQVWRSHSTKSVLDFVNSAENAIFVVNTVHLISQLADNLIIACGGLLPLLASATSPNVSLILIFIDVII